MVKCYSKKTLVVHKTGVKTLEETNEGDMVLTENGYEMVAKKIYRQTNEKDTVEMVFNTPAGSYHLTTSKDARLITSNGERKVNHTRGSDKIYVLNLKGEKEKTHVETAWCLIREPERMYNLELVNGGSYFANGILVKAAENGE